MLKRTKVVMLPTNESEIGFRNGSIYRKGEPFTQYGNANPQHLYILSDDEIEVGDWTIDSEIKYPHGQLCTIDNDAELKRYAHNSKYNIKKIIATTDPSLNLPSPSKAFIQKYCDKGGIDEIMVEYVEVFEDAYDEFNSIITSKPKSNKNQITIKPIPIKNYNRIEVIELCTDAYIIGTKASQEETSYNKDFLEFVKSRIDV